MSDYEEYTGKIETGYVALRLPVGSFEKTNFEAGAIVHEGDVLGEFVPFGDAKIQKAQEAVRIAEDARATNQQEAESRNKAIQAAEDELERVVQNAPHEKVVAPISGKLGNGVGGTYFTVPRTPRRIGGSGTGGRSGGSGGRGGRGGGGFGGSNRIPFNAIDPQDAMLVTFDVPESAVLAHRRMLNRKPGWELSLPVVCGLADDKGFPYRGKVVSVAKDIDASTHTQRWQALVPNKDGIFLPGMSVRVRLITSEPHRAMLVPAWPKSNRLKNDPDRHCLYVVNDRNVIETRTVVFGRRYDDDIEVKEGLNADDWVILQDEANVGQPDPGSTVKPQKVVTPLPTGATPASGASPPAAAEGGTATGQVTIIH